MTDGAAAALPWGRPQLEPGYKLELRFEQGPWLLGQVSEVHGGHQYTLLFDAWDDYVDGVESAQADAQPAAEAQPAAVGPADTAPDAATPAGARAQQPAVQQQQQQVEEEEEVVVYELRVRIIGDGILKVLDERDSSGGAESGDGAELAVWRPAATSMQQLMERALLDKASALPPGTGLSLTISDMAQQVAHAMKDVITRATKHACEAGTDTVDGGIMHRAIAEVAQELGLPAPQPAPQP